MRAVYIEAKERTVVRRAEVPVPGPGEVRLRVEYVGICGSDLHYYFEGANGEFVVREPLIPGHELSGRVDLDPGGLLAQGTAVTVHPARFGTPVEAYADEPHLWAGGSYLGSASTWPHTQGSMAEYLVVEREMVRVLPKGLPVRRAVLAEPLAVALHGVSKAGDLAGARVLVTGSGPIGLLSVAAARAAGAAEIASTDVLPGPLERAVAQGADRTVDVSREPVPENAFDVVLECSGVPASISAALTAARPAGTVVQVGMVPNETRPVNLAPFIAKELRFFGTFRFKDEIGAAVQLLAERPEIEQVITHEFTVDDPAAAFAAARDSQASGKVIVAL